MARPRVFVSSTYFDLKYVRASLDVFIKSLGYEPILSEKGDIAYTPDRPLDSSCYREAENSDLFVLIIGGRYGSEASGEKESRPKTFFERYDSITKKEYESAASREVPTYIFVEAGVHAEYLTYQRNKGLEQIKYAHVDSVNIFKLIDDILSKPRNNQVKTFERYDDIEAWLRDQWAGLFRELLARQTEAQQLNALTLQVNELSQINETMKNYLEAVVSKTVDNSQALISSEESRLEKARINAGIRSNDWFKHVNQLTNIGLSKFIEVMKSCNIPEEFGPALIAIGVEEDAAGSIASTLMQNEAAMSDFYEARNIVNARTNFFDTVSGLEVVPSDENNLIGRKIPKPKKPT